MTTPAGPASPVRSPATCLGCGCACDDIHVVVRDGRIVETGAACALGAAWFGDGLVPSRVAVDGRDDDLAAAIDAAASLLARAGRPLVYLAPDLSCETQRLGVAIADLLHGVLDHVTSATTLAGLLAGQERGRATSTLGEIRQRADVVVFWGVDPVTRYPRFRQRYGPDAIGVHAPDGRASRRVIAVDVGGAHGPTDADARVAIAPDDEVALLTTVIALVADPSRRADAEPSSSARTLADLLLAGRYVAIVADAEPEPGVPRDPLVAGQLIALGQTLNGATRASLTLLRAGGNRSGAEVVGTSQTGYPVAIDFSSGAPRYRPHSSTATSDRFDAALVLGRIADLPAGVRDALAARPLAIVGPSASESGLTDVRVAIDTAVPGIHEPGTAVRMDDVPLPLRAVLPGPPSAAAVAEALLDRLRQRA